MFSVIPILFAVAPPEQPLPPVLPSEAPAAASVQDADAEEKTTEWTGSFEVSGMNTDGNTNNLRLGLLGDVERKLDEERYNFHAEWIYTEDDGSISERRALVSGKYSRDITEKTYWLINGGASTDTEANVDLRYTAGAGLGYKFVNTDTWTFEGEAGLNYFVEQLDGSDDQDYFAGRLAYKVKYVHDETWSADHGTVGFPSLEDTDDVYVRMDTAVAAKLGDAWYAKARWIWDWDNTPADDSDKSDHMQLLTLGWGF